MVSGSLPKNGICLVHSKYYKSGLSPTKMEKNSNYNFPLRSVLPQFKVAVIFDFNNLWHIRESIEFLWSFTTSFLSVIFCNYFISRTHRSERKRRKRLSLFDCNNNSIIIYPVSKWNKYIFLYFADFCGFIYLHTFFNL